ncbi:MAG: hypothetical protein ACRCXZ_05855 [Patescibacteria group bacterium]
MSYQYEIKNGELHLFDDFDMPYQFRLDYLGLREFNKLALKRFKKPTKDIRSLFIESILAYKPKVEFVKTKSSIKLTFPFENEYPFSLAGLLQFKEDFRDISDIYNSFDVRLSFVSQTVGTFEALTIPNIIRVAEGSDWAHLMTNGLDWDLLNDPEIWIDEVKIIHELILDRYQAEVKVLSDHLPVVPQFKGFRLAPESFTRMAPPLIMMRGNCGVGKTSLLLSKSLPIMNHSVDDYGSFLDGVIAGDKFKTLLQPWLFDTYNHEELKVEGLLHVQGMSLCDLMLNWASENGLAAIIDNRLLCPVEIQRIAKLWGDRFAIVVIDIDGELPDLIERTRNRSFPRIDESVVLSGNLTARNERCVLLNSKYSYYLFKTKGTGRNIKTTLIAECHFGHFEVHSIGETEDSMPGQSIALGNPNYAAQAQKQG